MQVSVCKAAREDDAGILSLIQNELGYKDVDFEKLRGRLAQMRENEAYETFVAKGDGGVLGFIGLCRGIAYEVEGEYLRITALAVRRDEQHKGIGAMLVREAERYAALHHIAAVALSSGLQRKDAHAFYEHLGFHKQGYSFKKGL